jgi:predicted 3-demethylubiquinone-9 3-methyltransferase (glyoxalase superfamily)
LSRRENPFLKKRRRCRNRSRSFDKLVGPVLGRRIRLKPPASQQSIHSGEFLMPKITPFLWFDNQAEEAVNYYVSLFNNSKIGAVNRYGEEAAKVSGRAAGSVMTVAFELDGQHFTAINGGPIFQFTEAVSFVVNCDTQEEVDHFWNKLCEGGQPSQCGWLKDRYGLSWQIVPTVLGELLSSQEPGKPQRVMQALLQMTKLDIKKLQEA